MYTDIHLALICPYPSVYTDIHLALICPYPSVYTDIHFTLICPYPSVYTDIHFTLISPYPSVYTDIHFTLISPYPSVYTDIHCTLILSSFVSSFHLFTIPVQVLYQLRTSFVCFFVFFSIAQHFPQTYEYWMGPKTCAKNESNA